MPLRIDTQVSTIGRADSIQVVEVSGFSVIVLFSIGLVVFAGMFWFALTSFYDWFSKDGIGQKILGGMMALFVVGSVLYALGEIAIRGILWLSK